MRYNVDKAGTGVRQDRGARVREWERGSQTNKVYSGPLTSQERKRYGAAVGMEKKQHDAHWG